MFQRIQNNKEYPLKTSSMLDEKHTLTSTKNIISTLKKKNKVKLRDIEPIPMCVTAESIGHELMARRKNPMMWLKKEIKPESNMKKRIKKLIAFLTILTAITLAIIGFAIGPTVKLRPTSRQMDNYYAEYDKFHL